MAQTGRVCVGRHNETADRFERTLATVRGDLLAYTRHMLWRKDDLPDALQAILLTAYRRFSDFQPGSNFRAWIFRIATYEVFNFNRRSERERRILVSLNDEEPAAAELQAEIHCEELLGQPAVLDRVLSAELSAALSRLTHNERLVLLLRIVGGFSTLETARMLEMPAGSVMGFLGRARRKLRLALAAYASERGWLPRGGKVSRP